MFHFSKRSTFGEQYAASHSSSPKSPQQRSYKIPSGHSTNIATESSSSHHHVSAPPSLRSTFVREAAHRYSTKPSYSIPRKSPGPASPLARCNSMPHQNTPSALTTYHDIKRTASGGLLFRKKTFEEREEVSRTRAMELCAVFEQSEEHETDEILSLNPNGMKQAIKSKEFVRTPSFGMVSPQEAARRFQKQKEDNRRKVDPLRIKKETVSSSAKGQGVRRMGSACRQNSELSSKSSGSRGQGLRRMGSACRNPGKGLRRMGSACQNTESSLNGSESWAGESLASESWAGESWTGESLTEEDDFFDHTKGMTLEKQKESQLKAEMLIEESERNSEYTELNPNGIKVIPKPREMTDAPKLTSISPNEAAALYQSKFEKNGMNNNHGNKSKNGSMFKKLSGRFAKKKYAFDVPTLV